MVSRKQAPRQLVVEVERVGAWGDVTYRHRLACGHVEVRKRPAPADHISCMFCLHERERPAPKTSDAALQWLPETEFVEFDVFSSYETDASRLQASLAAKLGVANNAVNVHVNHAGVVMWVSVVLTAEESARLAR